MADMEFDMTHFYEGELQEAPKYPQSEMNSIHRYHIANKHWHRAGAKNDQRKNLKHRKRNINFPLFVANLLRSLKQGSKKPQLHKKLKR